MKRTQVYVSCLYCLRIVFLVASAVFNCVGYLHGVSVLCILGLQHVYIVMNVAYPLFSRQNAQLVLIVMYVLYQLFCKRVSIHYVYFHTYTF